MNMCVKECICNFCFSAMSNTFIAKLYLRVMHKLLEIGTIKYTSSLQALLV